MIVDDDIWEAIKLHPWKARPRYDGPILLVEIHATRSGIIGRTPLEEYYSTINWFKSPNNINEAETRPWASMASYIIGGGRRCRVMPDHYWPSYSLGHADPFAISIEIGQNLATTPFDPRDIDNAARLCAEISGEHPIPVRVLPFLSVDNHEAPGYVRHDRSANGAYYGKTDPGPLFNDHAFEELVRSYMQEDNMADEDMRRYSHAAGRMHHAYSDVQQWGLVADVPLRGALRFLAGAGPEERPPNKERALGVLQYAAAMYEQMTSPNDGAKRMIRWLARGESVS